MHVFVVILIMSWPNHPINYWQPKTNIVIVRYIWKNKVKTQHLVNETINLVLQKKDQTFNLKTPMSSQLLLLESIKTVVQNQRSTNFLKDPYPYRNKYTKSLVYSDTTIVVSMETATSSYKHVFLFYAGPHINTKIASWLISTTLLYVCESR